MAVAATIAKRQTADGVAAATKVCSSRGACGRDRALGSHRSSAESKRIKSKDMHTQTLEQISRSSASYASCESQATTARFREFETVYGRVPASQRLTNCRLEILYEHI
uniref:Uncharacterized protein n=1 Tax=Ceratitis capitata TaxID=7213 RepID=W8BMS7_CERCA